MNISAPIAIEMDNVTLTYDLYFSKADSLKEKVINFIHRRRHVEKSKESFDALKGVSLKVYAGERLGIIGKNGAGKSTLLKALAGIIKPQGGKITVSGPTQPLIEVGAGFNPELSGRENLYLNGYMLGFSRAELKEKEAEIISFAELHEFIDVPVKYYSSGMAVRLAFAIATSVNPNILLFDEMLAAGDETFRIKSKERLDKLIDNAKCIALVSHSMPLVKAFCTRVIVLDKGQIVFDGDAANGVDFYTKL